MTLDEYLDGIRATPAEVERFLRGRGEDGLQPNRGWTYDAELGWVHADAVHAGDGEDGSDTFYHYEEDGARRVVNHPEAPYRIAAFGDSYTHGDQVNDGETWPEYLAAHLCEPVRNYGVGGYSVYQAYRRMKKVLGDDRADISHVLLNIYEDDHFRNLDSYRALRHGRRSNCGFTLPHVRVDPDTDAFEERDNLIARPEDVYQLCDLDYLRRTFADDPIARMALRLRTLSDARSTEMPPVPITVGMLGSDADSDEARRIKTEYVRAALYATRRVVERIEAFCNAKGSKLLVMLSFSAPTMAKALRGEEMFDRPFSTWLCGRGYPVLDMRPAFAAEFADSRRDATHFLEPYYNGHHTPAGNFFTARALRRNAVAWIDPAPGPYRRATPRNADGTFRGAEQHPLVRERAAG